LDYWIAWGFAAGVAGSQSDANRRFSRALSQMSFRIGTAGGLSHSDF
jgi:hypothetical protein